MRGRGAFCAIVAVAVLAGFGSALAGAATGYRLLVLDGDTVKWGAPVLGTGAIVTYALVDSTMAFDGARNCGRVGPMRGLLHANGVSDVTFGREVAAAFAVWSSAADIQFEPASAQTAEILIGAQGEPSGRAFTNVAHAAGPAAGTRSITRSVICLNPDRKWKVGFDGDLTVYDLRYTLEHEIGHAIGLDHPGVPGVLMDFRYREKIDAPQVADIAGAIALYGERHAAPPAAVATLPAPGVIAASASEVGSEGLTAVPAPHMFRP